MSQLRTPEVKNESSLSIQNILADFFLKKIDMASHSDDSDLKQKSRKKKSKHKKRKHKKSKRHHHSGSFSSSSESSEVISKGCIDGISSSEEMDIKRLKKIKKMKFKAVSDTVLKSSVSFASESVTKSDNQTSSSSKENPVYYGPSLELLLSGVESNSSNLKSAQNTSSSGDAKLSETNLSMTKASSKKDLSENTVLDNSDVALPSGNVNSHSATNNKTKNDMRNTALCTDINDCVTDPKCENDAIIRKNYQSDSKITSKHSSEEATPKISKISSLDSKRLQTDVSNPKTIIKESDCKTLNKDLDSKTVCKESDSKTVIKESDSKNLSLENSSEKASYSENNSINRATVSNEPSVNDANHKKKQDKSTDVKSKSSKKKHSRSRSRSKSHNRHTSPKPKHTRRRSRSSSCDSHSARKKRRHSRSRSRSRGRFRSRDRKRRSHSKSRSRSRDRKRRSHSKSHSRSRDRKRRSHSKSRSRSRSRHRRHKRNSRSRSPHRRHGRRKTRSRSRSYSRSRRHSKSRTRRSRSRERRRSLSKSKHAKSRKSRSHSRSKRSKSRSKSKSRHKSPHKEKSHSRSSSAEKKRASHKSGKIDQAKVLEMARKNVLKMMKSGTLPEGLPVENLKKEQLISIQAGGKSVQELTDFCQRLSQKENEPNDSDNEDNGDKTEDESGFIHHPFKVKEPGMIKLNIKNAVQLPIKTHAQKVAELSSQFPVSSGNQHKKKELEWVPVVPESSKTETKPETTVSTVVSTKKAAVALPEVTNTPVPLPPPPPPPLAISYPCPPPPEVPKVEELPVVSVVTPPTAPVQSQMQTAVPCQTIYQVSGEHVMQMYVPPEQQMQYSAISVPSTTFSTPSFPTFSTPSASVFKPPKKLDISSIVAKRFQAITKLQSNPNDPESLKTLQDAQESIQEWVQSQQVPGLFTGSTDAKVLSAAELCGPYNKYHKSRKDFLSQAPPVTSGKGMSLLKKMGWNPGEGLGKNKEGSLEPLVLDIKMDKKGLVSEGENSKKGVSSFIKELQGKHPVSALMELCSKRRWKPPLYTCVVDTGPPHKKLFCFKVEVNGVEYQPVNPSSNKKIAKADSAVLCLQALNVLPKSA